MEYLDTLKQKSAPILAMLREKAALIGRDKWLHFGGSALLTLILAPMLGYWAALLVAAVGIGKEFSDRDTTGFSWPDLAADGLGILLGVMAWTVVV